jgi:hypothetical protein
MSKTAMFMPITDWGRWLHDLAQLSDAEIADRDIADINLRCAKDLPAMDNSLLGACLQKVDDWAVLVDRCTAHLFPHFRRDPERFQGSESRFRVGALAECLQRYIGITYNFAFLEGDYDASDSRNLFIHGILTGFGGTCVSMPVLYCAIGRRLGYPLTMAETREHCFCRWDDDSEHFCFDATSRGVPIRDEDYYRRWPKPITPAQERNNGFVRSLTRREELAAFAAARGNCLLDNFQFTPAVEAFYLAHQVAPGRPCYHDDWGLAVYSAKLWGSLQRHPVRDDIPVEQAIGMAAEKLRGPDSEFFREHAAQNVLRILRNRRRRDRIAGHAAVLQNLSTPL